MLFVLDEEFYDDLFDRGLLPEQPSKSKTSSRPATPQETDKQESILESHQDDVVQFEDDPSELSDNLSQLSDDSQTELSCCSPGKPKETNQQQKSHQDEVVPLVPEQKEVLFVDDLSELSKGSQAELSRSSPGKPKETKQQQKSHQDEVMPVSSELEEDLFVDDLSQLSNDSKAELSCSSPGKPKQTKQQQKSHQDEVVPLVPEQKEVLFVDDLSQLPDDSQTELSCCSPGKPKETNQQQKSHQDEVVPLVPDQKEVLFVDDLSELSHDSKAELSRSSPGKPKETKQQRNSHQDDVMPVSSELEEDLFVDDLSRLPDDSQTELSCSSPGKPKETNQQQKSHQDEVVSDIPERNEHSDDSQEELPIKTELIRSPGTPKKTNNQNGVVPVAPALSLHGGKPEFTDDTFLLPICSTRNMQSKLETCIKEEFNKTPKTPDGIGDTVKAKPTNIKCLGLPNLSNTCYMNSSLQGLLTLENFVQDLQRQKQVWDPLCDAQLLRDFLAIKDAHTSSDINSKRGLLYSFKDVVSVQAPEFRDYEQKDAHEFITSVLGQMRNLSPLLQDIATCMGLTYTCPVERNMVFQMENIRTCKRCGKQSRRDEVFTNLSLDLFPGVSVEEMLQEYQKETKLEYKCECGGRTSGQRSTFKTMPKVLILHLKRFRLTSDYRMEKLHYAIKLQSNLQVSGNEVDTCYSLVSTVSHLGYSGEGGHYICNSVHPDDSPDKPTDRWLTFNDLEVVRTTGVSVCKQQKESAYILFYKKQE